MTQTIDLRKKEEAVKPVESFEKEPDTTQVVEAELASSGTSWLTYLAPPLPKERAVYAASILGIAALLVGLFAKDLLLTLLLALAGVVILLNMYRPDKPNKISVHATGISIDDEHHHFADMKSFWIDYQPHIKEISIEFKKNHRHNLRIPLEDSNPLEIRQAMISYVPEKEHELSLLDHVVRIIGI